MPNAIKWTNEKAYVNLIRRPSKSEAGEKLKQVVLFRLELSMDIAQHADHSSI